MSRETTTNGAHPPLVSSQPPDTAPRRMPWGPPPPPEVSPSDTAEGEPSTTGHAPPPQSATVGNSSDRVAPSSGPANGNGHPPEAGGTGTPRDEEEPATVPAHDADQVPVGGHEGPAWPVLPGPGSEVTALDLLADAPGPGSTDRPVGEGQVDEGQVGEGQVDEGSDDEGTTTAALDVLPSPAPDGLAEADPEAPPTFDDEAPAALKARRLRDLRYQRRFGVAPFVQPSARRSHRQRRRDYRKLGFVELTQDKAKLRHRVLPRTVIGVSTLIAAFGVGSAFAGAALYAYYDNRLTENEARVTEFATGFENNYNAAITQIQQQRDDAVQSLAVSIDRVQQAIDDANAMVELPARVGGGVWLIRTVDPAGRPTMGSAFAVPVRDGEEGASYLLTAYEVVSASTAQPGPAVTVERAGEVVPAEVWAWDPDRGLALLKVARPDLVPMAFAPDQERASARGSRVYALSALGGEGATVSPGNVTDVSDVGLRHNIVLSTDFRGGPIVNAAGQVLGISTTTYQPLGFDPGPMPYAPSVEGACQQVLSCPPGLLSGG